MVAIVAPEYARQSLQLLASTGERASLIGEVRAGTAGVVID